MKTYLIINCYLLFSLLPYKVIVSIVKSLDLLLHKVFGNCFFILWSHLFFSPSLEFAALELINILKTNFLIFARFNFVLDLHL